MRRCGGPRPAARRRWRCHGWPPLPAAGLDHPRRRQLAVAVVVAREHRQRRMLAGQQLGLFARQHRVLEEAAGIAEHVRVGQFAAADGDDRVGDVGGHRQLHSHRLQLLADAGVIQAQLVQQRQAELHGGDQVAVGLVLEQAVAVAEAAGRMVQLHPLRVQRVPGLHRLDELADLGTVGADVLDRRGADGAGNQRQVFQPGQAFGQRPHHQFVPDHAGTGADHGMVGTVLEDRDLAVVEAQHGAFRIGGEQHVAAAAQHQQRRRRHRGQGLGQRGRVAHAQQPWRAGGDVEGIEGMQRGVCGQRPGCSVCHSGATAPRDGASRRRRMASTHSPISAGPRKIRPL